MGIRIGYLTDIHLREAIPGASSIETRHCRSMARLLPEALVLLSRRAPDLIVCTGDLVDLPEGPGVFEDLRFCRGQFEACGVPYLVLPGNHDPLPDDFYRVFPRPQQAQVINGCMLVSFHEDACLEGEQACRRSDQSLEIMAELLIQTDRSPEVTLLFQHYVIYPDLSDGYPHNYRNDGEIRRILERSDQGILSVSGHYHPGIPLVQENGVSYFGGQAFCEAPYPCYLIEASGKGITIEPIEMRKAGP